MATFSNTHLRIPQGFAELLMGLAKEVLRDQPEDIPKYAAQYFEALFKQREESGMDRAEWTAKLESSVNHAFKDNRASSGKESTGGVSASKEESIESRAENETCNSAEDSEHSATRPKFSEEDHLIESAAEEMHEENRNISTEKGFCEEESIKLPQTADMQSDELSVMDDQKDPTIYKPDKTDRAAQEKDIRSVIDKDVSQSLSTDVLSFSGASHLDVCAQELGITEEGGRDKQESQVVDKEMSQSEIEGQENTEVKESVVFPQSGQADVDICAAELGGAERKMENATAKKETHTTEEESFKSQPEEALVQSSLAQFETPEGNQQEVEDRPQTTQEHDETDTNASAGEAHEGLASNENTLDIIATLKEDSLIEISFEDVPEDQQITEVREKQPDEESSVDVLQTEQLETQQEEECAIQEVTAEATDSMSGMQHQDEPETEVENEFNSERQSQLKASDRMKENVLANCTNIDDSHDDDRGEDSRISSSHQHTTEDKENTEGETVYTNESEQIRENIFCSEAKKSDFEDDETTDTGGEVNEDIGTADESEVKDEDGDGGAETHSSQALVDAWSDDTLVEKEEEESKEKGNESDPEAQEKSDDMCEEESIGPSHGTAADHHVEEVQLGSGPGTAQLEKNKAADKEECSRPQEEEDIMDIPLDDPEANRAAAKIQAGFRGHMTRKKMKPEDKAEGEEVSSTGDVLNGSQGATASGGSGAVESDDTSVPEQ